MLVLAEAGGILTDIKGVPLKLGQPGRRHEGLIAAANNTIARQVRGWFASRK
jgi:fructose-1,6-bisphosphatase/inositol monophosphatase family enzyme